MRLGCASCAGSAEPGWVCADHPDQPWQHDDCEAEGAPCNCNPAGRVGFVKVLASDVPDAPGFPVNEADQDDVRPLS